MLEGTIFVHNFLVHRVCARARVRLSGDFETSSVLLTLCIQYSTIFLCIFTP